MSVKRSTHEWHLLRQGEEGEMSNDTCIRSRGIVSVPQVKELGFSPAQEEMETEMCTRCPIERQPFNQCSHSQPEMGQNGDLKFNYHPASAHLLHCNSH